ncbi:MAG: NADH-quinone oxidoreductase subunit J [Desulfuromonas sp.]|nr:NADH-quinone oxidoreductase subunit J [Desulfuromonas sp.]
MGSVVFYLLAAATLTATLLCITRTSPVHAVIYLVHAFFDLALIFYLFGAPLVAAWEMIIYAGAVMVLFLFIIMMLELATGGKPLTVDRRRWVPVLLLSLVTLACTVLLIIQDPSAVGSGPAYHVSPRDFGTVLFDRYALAVQVVSFQLLFAAVGAYYVGKGEPRKRGEQSS